MDYVNWYVGPFQSSVYRMCRRSSDVKPDVIPWIQWLLTVP